MQKDSQVTIPYKVIKQNADTLTPIGIFNALQGKKKFLLESSFLHEEKGKFSFIGTDPYREMIGRQTTTTIMDHENGTQEIVNGEILSLLHDFFPKLDIDLPLPFVGGAVGYIGYDAIRAHKPIGDELPNDLDMPDVHLMLYKNIIAFDHQEESVYLIAINHNNQPEANLDIQLEKLKNALSPIQTVSILEEEDIVFEPEMDKQQFLNNVAVAKRHIDEEDVLQVVLSQRMKASFAGDPFSFYRKLRKTNPSPYMFYIDFDDYLIIGASPESLIQVKESQVMTNPIAGTRPRGISAAEDDRLIKELLTDQKELSEHQMLVDLSIQELRSVCEMDSISIPTYMKVEKYEHVMHIVSEVHGELAANSTSIDALRACLPAGTVSGAPKLRAMQIINELENKKRGVYGGGIGYISFHYDLNIALAIRSLIIKEKQAFLQAGAGIVADSVPEKEYLETLHKAKSLLKAAEYSLT